MKKLIIEARVNEYAPRTHNRNVPWSTAEIVADSAACRQAGASVMHFHARLSDGAPDHRYETYRDTVAAVLKIFQGSPVPDWSIASSVQAARLVTGAVRTGRRSLVQVPGRSSPLDLVEITGLA